MNNDAAQQYKLSFLSISDPEIIKRKTLFINQDLSSDFESLKCTGGTIYPQREHIATTKNPVGQDLKKSTDDSIQYFDQSQEKAVTSLIEEKKFSGCSQKRYRLTKEKSIRHQKFLFDASKIYIFGFKKYISNNLIFFSRCFET